MYTKAITVAWDVIMEITFGKSMGFMEHAKDVKGLLGMTSSIMDYASAVSPHVLLLSLTLPS